ncbi:hypothetical protein HCN44_007218 [Aphidius gifuensis]|uniref:Uncharacterized protein n=1 Tax=Aphidius gifuensis TaxID=684658 RepID=A0A835CP85_APHGI|nr:hypothetical protein HCN44_007218 [Aphidius gifuensis]
MSSASYDVKNEESSSDDNSNHSSASDKNSLEPVNENLHHQYEPKTLDNAERENTHSNESELSYSSNSESSELFDSDCSDIGELIQEQNLSDDFVPPNVEEPFHRSAYSKKVILRTLLVLAENNDIDTQPTRPVNLATKLDAIANENKTIPLESIKDLAMKSLNNKRKSEAVETQEKISNDQYVTKKDLHDVLNSFFSGLNQKTLKRQKTSSDTDIDSDDEYKSNPGTSKTISNNNKEVKMIGSGENKYPIPRAKWDIAKLQPTFTRMSWHLVMASFDENILLKSNYQGGRSKKKKIEEDNKLEKLDRNKMNAIKETVKLHFKEKFNDSIFGTNVNTRLSQLRHDAHKPQQLEKKNQKKMTDTDESL